MSLDSGEIIEISGFLGSTTNNVAEYEGLLEALRAAAAEGATELDIVSDSEQLVKQMLGLYRVKHPNLIPLHREAKQMVRRFRKFSIRHTLRAGNKNADRLANVGIVVMLAAIFVSWATTRSATACGSAIRAAAADSLAAICSSRDWRSTRNR